MRNVCVCLSIVETFQMCHTNTHNNLLAIWIDVYYNKSNENEAEQKKEVVWLCIVHSNGNIYSERNKTLQIIGILCEFSEPLRLPDRNFPMKVLTVKCNYFDRYTSTSSYTHTFGFRAIYSVWYQTFYCVECMIAPTSYQTIQNIRYPFATCHFYVIKVCSTKIKLMLWSWDIRHLLSL